MSSTSRYLFSIFLLLSTLSYAQVDVPTNYFSSPLDIPLRLSGTFGELRSNHFHTGLDMKTRQRIGYEVHAAGPGYISRIKVRPWGYGRAIYIQHPNGYTTVYGHLSRFAPEIQQYVKEKQYYLESWNVELYPGPEDFKIEKGEIIAYSGNSGSSGGPHLHFEIRDSHSRPMNPMLFGIEVADSRNPIIQGLFVYPVGDKAYANHSATRKKLRLIRVDDNTFRTDEVKAFGKIGFGVSAVDQLNGASNKDGIYKVETFCNGSNIFEIVFNRVSFSNTRYINRMIDYSYKEKHNMEVQKLFLQPNNPLSVYKNVVNRGFIDVKAGNDYMYVVKVSDFAGNTSTIRIPISGEKLPNINFPEVHKTDYYAKANSNNVFEIGKFDVYIPEGALYENVYLDISVKDGVLHLHNDLVPLHKNITIGIDVSNYSAKDQKQLCIARAYPWGSEYYVDTEREKDRLVTYTRIFGNYTLATDNEPPKIEPLNFSDGRWISNNETLKLRITDSFSGVDDYRATVNGEFIVMAYNPDNNTITYDFDDGVVTDTENHLKVIVIDDVGNSTTFEAVFYRKN